MLGVSLAVVSVLSVEVCEDIGDDGLSDDELVEFSDDKAVVVSELSEEIVLSVELDVIVISEGVKGEELDSPVSTVVSDVFRESVAFEDSGIRVLESVTSEFITSVESVSLEVDESEVLVETSVDVSVALSVVFSSGIKLSVVELSVVELSVVLSVVLKSIVESVVSDDNTVDVSLLLLRFLRTISLP